MRRAKLTPMAFRGWIGEVIGFGLWGTAYGLVLSFRMGLAGTALDSLWLMAYVGFAFLALGSLLYLLKAGLRAGVHRLVDWVGGRPKTFAPRSLPSTVVASLGSSVLVFSVLLASGDVLLNLAFRPETSRLWLSLRVLLVLAAGSAAWWLLIGPVACRADRFLRTIRDPHGVKCMTGTCALLLVIALSGPFMGAATPRWKNQRPWPPAGLRVSDTGLKVLLFGVDGASWTVFKPLIDEGLLPETGRLVERGARATLLSLPPQVSPAIWTTIVTGRRPEEHGVREYLLVSFPNMVNFPFEALADDLLLVPFLYVGLGYFVAGVAEGIPPTGDQVRVKSIWHMLADGGEKSLLLGWPATWPAEPMPGLTVTDRFFPAGWDVFSSYRGPPGRAVNPREAEDRLRLQIQDSKGVAATIFGEIAFLPEEEVAALRRFTYNPLLPGPLSLLADVYHADVSKLGILRSEIASRSYQLALVMLDGIDLTMHAFWKERFPEDFGLRQSVHPAWGRLIDATHRLVDGRVGEILDAAGEGTVVILISDHGMKADPGNLIWPGWHAPEALLILSGGPVRRGVEMLDVTYLDIAPTVLYLLGYPVPRDLPGRVLTEYLEEEFLERFPVRTISSYEALQPPE